jgi:hypothetical protein
MCPVYLYTVVRFAFIEMKTILAMISVPSDFRLHDDVLKGKGKAISVLFLTEQHAMKAYWGVEAQFHAFLTSALDGGEWSVSCPGRLTPRERARRTHWIRGWVDPTASLEGGEEKNSQPLGLEPPIIQPVAQRYTAELSRFLNDVLVWQIVVKFGSRYA